MNKLLPFLLVLTVIISGCNCCSQSGSCPFAGSSKGWVSLFDGKSLDGWKASESIDSFAVQDGKIVADGPRSHLFYTGPVNNADFKNFEYKVDVMTTPGANAGLYFHTKLQQSGWPSEGFEAQVNNTFTSDPRKTGSLYRIQDVMVTPVDDNTWFTEHVIVRDKNVVIKVNGVKLVDYTEPDDAERKLSSGTFALQCHDPKSKVYFKNIMVKPLP